VLQKKRSLVAAKSPRQSLHATGTDYHSAAFSQTQAEYQRRIALYAGWKLHAEFLIRRYWLTGSVKHLRARRRPLYSQG